MGSVRKQEANRRNAQKSTGPRTPAGRARASRNALKHGLAAAGRDPGHASRVSELVQDLLDELEISQEYVPELLAIIEAEVDLLRARYIRASLLQDLLNQMKEDALDGSVAALLDQLTRADRYERRALSRRKFAVRDLTKALNKPSVSPAGDEVRRLLNRCAA
jgi:hypothetical protein